MCTFGFIGDHHQPPKVYTFGFIGDDIIPKSFLKCSHSATGISGGYGALCCGVWRVFKVSGSGRRAWSGDFVVPGCLEVLRLYPKLCFGV